MKYEDLQKIKIIDRFGDLLRIEDRKNNRVDWRKIRKDGKFKYLGEQIGYPYPVHGNQI